ELRKFSNSILNVPEICVFKATCRMVFSPRGVSITNNDNQSCRYLWQNYRDKPLHLAKLKHYGANPC
ncbi:MAG: hypothetical protein VX649_14705, partial [Pseudomonadota bacterium]|nr:hypothetical protein [Pseudomonadota bacterium]